MVLLINNLRIIQIFASPLADFSIELLNSTIDSTINSKLLRSLSARLILAAGNVTSLACPASGL